MSLLLSSEAIGEVDKKIETAIANKNKELEVRFKSALKIFKYSKDPYSRAVPIDFNQFQRLRNQGQYFPTSIHLDIVFEDPSNEELPQFRFDYCHQTFLQKIPDNKPVKSGYGFKVSLSEENELSYNQNLLSYIDKRGNFYRIRKSAQKYITRIRLKERFSQRVSQELRLDLTIVREQQFPNAEDLAHFIKIMETLLLNYYNSAKQTKFETSYFERLVNLHSIIPKPKLTGSPQKIGYLIPENLTSFPKQLQDYLDDNLPEFSLQYIVRDVSSKKDTYYRQVGEEIYPYYLNQHKVKIGERWYFESLTRVVGYLFPKDLEDNIELFDKYRQNQLKDYRFKYLLEHRFNEKSWYSYRYTDSDQEHLISGDSVFVTGENEEKPKETKEYSLVKDPLTKIQSSFSITDMQLALAEAETAKQKVSDSKIADISARQQFEVELEMVPGSDKLNSQSLLNEVTNILTFIQMTDPDNLITTEECESVMNIYKNQVGLRSNRLFGVLTGGVKKIQSSRELEENDKIAQLEAREAGVVEVDYKESNDRHKWIVTGKRFSSNISQKLERLPLESKSLGPRKTIYLLKKDQEQIRQQVQDLFDSGVQESVPKHIRYTSYILGKEPSFETVYTWSGSGSTSSISNLKQEFQTSIKHQIVEFSTTSIQKNIYRKKFSVTLLRSVSKFNKSTILSKIQKHLGNIHLNYNVKHKFVWNINDDEQEMAKRLIDLTIKDKFVGPLPQSFDRREIENNTIRNNYSVTDKADGERVFMMFINGTIYLMGRNLWIRKTRMRTSRKEITIIDAEYLDKDNRKEFIDANFRAITKHYQGELSKILFNKSAQELQSQFNVIQNIFQKSDFAYRYRNYLQNDSKQLIEQIVAVMAPLQTTVILPFDILIDEGHDLRLVHQVSGHSFDLRRRLDLLKKAINTVNTHGLYMRMKTFYFSDDSNIHAASSELLEADPVTRGYAIDGLIFTPSLMSYKYIDSKGRLLWRQLLKYKPPEHNSIDFLVEVGGKQDIAVPGGNIIEVVEIRLYVSTRKAFLDTSDHTGKVTKRVAYYLGERFSQQAFWVPDTKETIHINTQQELKTDKGPFILFTTDEHPDIGTSYIKMTEFSKNPQLRHLRTNQIVECVWTFDPDLKMRLMKPTRIRFDKILTPNYIDTAISAWRTMVNPVTKQEIVQPVAKETLTEVTETTGSIRKFHNWVKRSIYSLFYNCSSVLDLASGRGGDLPKYFLQEFEYVVGLELNSRSITEAEKRYRGMISRSTKQVPLVRYSEMDLSALDPETIYTFLANREIGMEFDVVSCMFALHYFFKDEQTIRNLLKNISDNLRQDGYFVGTVYDGEILSRALEGLKKGSVYSINGVLSVKKKYTNAQLKKSCYNNQISVEYHDSVYFEGLTDEYLVDFSKLTELCREYDLELDSFNSVTFDELYPLWKHTKRNIKDLSELEQQASFFNRTFCFRKVSPSIVSRNKLDINLNFREKFTEFKDITQQTSIEIQTSRRSKSLLNKLYGPISEGTLGLIPVRALCTLGRNLNRFRRLSISSSELRQALKSISKKQAKVNLTDSLEDIADKLQINLLTVDIRIQEFDCSARNYHDQGPFVIVYYNGQGYDLIVKLTTHSRLSVRYKYSDSDLQITFTASDTVIKSIRKWIDTNCESFGRSEDPYLIKLTAPELQQLHRKAFDINEKIQRTFWVADRDHPNNTLETMLEVANYLNVRDPSQDKNLLFMQIIDEMRRAIISEAIESKKAVRKVKRKKTTKEKSRKCAKTVTVSRKRASKSKPKRGVKKVKIVHQ